MLEFEIVANMKNGDVKPSKTYICEVETSVADEDLGTGGGPGGSTGSSHSHSNLSILNQITSIKISEWDNKVDGDYVQDKINEAQLGGGDVDLSGYAKVKSVPIDLQLDTHLKLKTPDGVIGTGISKEELKGNVGPQGPAGKDGVTPNITIGSVNTLEPGQKATVTKRGTKEEPIFDFAIPKGAKGDAGTGGAGGSNLGSNNTWTGTNKFTNVATFEKNDEVQRMQPSTPNSACFYSFYKNKNNRSGYFGYESSQNSDFVICNEASGANINLKTSGNGKAMINGKELALKDDLRGKSHSVKCSELGMTPDDRNNNNHQLLCNAINEGNCILVDGEYVLNTQNIHVINKNIDIKGITTNSKLNIKFNSFNDGIFKTNGNIDISIKNIKFTSTLSTKIINMANPTGVLGFVEIEGCKFENKVRIFDFVADGTVNPKDNFYGLDTFVFKNNIITDEKYAAIVITDAQYNNVIISDNTIHNLSNLFAIISIKNESTYSDDLPSYRHRTTITNNYVKNDDSCSATEVTGSYYCFVVLESDYVYYARNHVEGMKTLQDVVCYDIYASSREVVYENNMCKNVIAINPSGSQFNQGTALMMAKGNNGSRIYRNNTFILEKSFVEKMGKTVNDVRLKLFHNTSATSWKIEGNRIEVCRLDGQSSNTDADVELCNNTLRVENWGKGSLTNSSVGRYNIISNNDIQIKNIIQEFGISSCYIKQSEPVLTNYVVTNNLFDITVSKHTYLYDQVSSANGLICNNTYRCNCLGDSNINNDSDPCKINNLRNYGDKWIINKRPRAFYRQLVNLDEYSVDVEWTGVLAQDSRDVLFLKGIKDVSNGFNKTYVMTIEYFTEKGWSSATTNFTLQKNNEVCTISFTPLSEDSPQTYTLFTTQGNNKKLNLSNDIPFTALLSNSQDNNFIYFTHDSSLSSESKRHIVKYKIRSL